MQNLIDTKWTHNKRFPLDEIEKELKKVKKNNTLNLAGKEWNIYYKKNDFFYNNDLNLNNFDCDKIKQDYQNIQAILLKNSVFYSCIKDLQNSKIIDFKNSSFLIVKKK